MPAKDVLEELPRLVLALLIVEVAPAVKLRLLRPPAVRVLLGELAEQLCAISIPMRVPYTHGGLKLLLFLVFA